MREFLWQLRKWRIFWKLVWRSKWHWCISSSSSEEETPLPINEIDKDTPLGENEPAHSKKQKFKGIPEIADLLWFY